MRAGSGRGVPTVRVYELADTFLVQHLKGARVVYTFTFDTLAQADAHFTAHTIRRGLSHATN